MDTPLAGAISRGVWTPEMSRVADEAARELQAELRAKHDAEREAKRKRVASALKHINRRRARFGERALDPVAAEWTDEDVIAEAKRTGWLG